MKKLKISIICLIVFLFIFVADVSLWTHEMIYRTWFTGIAMLSLTGLLISVICMFVYAFRLDKNQHSATEQPKQS